LEANLVIKSTEWTCPTRYSAQSDNDVVRLSGLRLKLIQMGGGWKVGGKWA